jgi:diaminopimelate epimerase
MNRFWKMSGAGNDFVVFDNREGTAEALLTGSFVRGICCRGTSVGADGVITLEASDGFPFAMRYWNRDGRTAAMCGNGGRCACVFARLMGAVDGDGPFSFGSDAGEHRGLITGPSSARIWLTDPVVHFLDETVDYGGSCRISLIDTGVRHAVLFTDGQGMAEFDRLAGSLRHNQRFAPGGANVNYAVVTGKNSMRLRTFEKGVEGETLACGTGAAAVALAARETLGDAVELPLEITVGSGQVLTVGEDESGWWLQGEARIVYSGILEAPLS